MKKQILINASMLLLLTVVLSSCSSSYEARRFSNLDYVKANKHAPAQTSVAKETVKPLPGKPSDPLEATDYSASNEKQLTPKAITKKPSVKQDQPQKIAADQFLQIVGSSKKEIKQVVKAIVKEKSEITAELSKRSMTDDPQKLLYLWLIFAGASILFAILGAITVSATATTSFGIFGLLSLLAGLAAAVFFVLWIVAIAST
jgi:hypothetical protein